ncbi:MAG: hypothetical protein EA398_05280 [Deltaproteobacteria bacterium]|nr:MAG: hypothetical protein EA398_05280 [Deltaproteobacteria bacterium]
MNGKAGVTFAWSLRVAGWAVMLFVVAGCGFDGSALNSQPCETDADCDGGSCEAGFCVDAPASVGPGTDSLDPPSTTPGQGPGSGEPVPTAPVESTGSGGGA